MIKEAKFDRRNPSSSNGEELLMLLLSVLSLLLQLTHSSLTVAVVLPKFLFNKMTKSDWENKWPLQIDFFIKNILIDAIRSFISFSLHPQNEIFFVYLGSLCASTVSGSNNDALIFHIYSCHKISKKYLPHILSRCERSEQWRYKFL